MVRMMKRRSGKSGLPPGSLVYVGERKSHGTRISVIDYDDRSVSERELADVGECLPFKDSHTVTWINVDEIGDPGLVEQFGRVLAFHPLMLEDILNTDQRAKVEDHGDYIYVVLKMLDWDDERHEIVSEQLSLVLGQHYVITLQERAGDFFDPLRKRIRDGVGRHRRQGADYLAYSLLDVIIDQYFLVLDRLGDRIEAADTGIMSRNSADTLRQIHQLKRDMLFVRKAVWPVKEVVASLRHLDTPLIARQTAPYLRDIQDHIVQVVEGIDTYQNLLSDILATYLSTIGNRTNAVMKVLAVFSAVFMPLTFITGIFGMNFHHMPPLEWSWGFTGTLMAMLAIGVILAIFFIRKRWI
ncbi:MAG: magnesium/cobalt transporter CorA [Burkholderiales bacterium]